MSARIIVTTIAISTVLSMASPTAFAQETAVTSQPLVEISGGYSFMRDVTIEENFPAGWYFSTAVNPLEWFGVVGEVTGARKTLEENSFVELKVQAYTFMGGAHFFRRFGLVTPYGQFLVGGAHGQVEATLQRPSGLSVTESSTEFAFQPGGGVNVYLNDHIGLNLSVDYRRIVFDNDEEDNSEFRMLTGVVIGFGGR